MPIASLADMHKKLSSGAATATSLAEDALAAIEEGDGSINAFLEVYDDVREQARAADIMLSQGKGGPLTGIPIAIKDNILVAGKQVTAASKILSGYTAPYDATVIVKLKEAGAVLIGRTNCDEFAMGSSTENSAYGTTKNPHDTTRVPGGSSGGSAAAVAAGFVPLALGSDTGGSIRQPASFCGIVGLKPTYGAVSRYGLIAMGSSLDVIGPFAHTVADAKALFDVIKGHDENDSTSLPNTSEDHPKKKNRFVGVPRAFLAEGIDPLVLAQFEETLEQLAQKGHEIVDVDLPHASHALPVYYIIMPAEASTNLSRFDGIRYGLSIEGKDLIDGYVQTRAQGFGPEVRRRILLGAYVLSSGYYDAYYGKATKVRELIKKDFDHAFTQVDVIVTPTAPTPPFLFGGKSDPLSMYLADIFTVPANIAGIPAISVPMGSVAPPNTSAQLPLGIQFLANYEREDLLFEMGAQVEAVSQ